MCRDCQILPAEEGEQITASYISAKRTRRTPAGGPAIFVPRKLPRGQGRPADAILAHPIPLANTAGSSACSGRRTSASRERLRFVYSTSRPAATASAGRPAFMNSPALSAAPCDRPALPRRPPRAAAYLAFTRIGEYAQLNCRIAEEIVHKLYKFPKIIFTTY